MSIAQAPQQRQKSWRRNIDAAAYLNGFDQNRADLFGFKKLLNLSFEGIERRIGPRAVTDLLRAGSLSFREGHKARELLKLAGER